MARTFVFVCKDPGGTANLLPVFDEMKTRESCILIADGNAKESLKGVRDFETFDSCHGVLRLIPQPAALITSMCSRGGIGRDLIPHLKGKCQTIALQDFWGGGLWNDWSMLRFRPNYIVVNDRIGKNIVKQAWPEYRNIQIKIFGYPALDAYSSYNRRTAREILYKKLAIPTDHKVVLYTAQLQGAAYTMYEILCALRGQWGDCVDFIPRLHPRTITDAPEEYRTLNQALMHRLGHLSILPFTDILSRKELIGAADIVISEYSTTLVEAAAIRSTPISVLYPNEGMRRFRRSMGNALDEFPLVSLGCAAKAEDRTQLCCLIDTALHKPQKLNLQASQRKHIHVDGKNAQRVADFVLSLV